MTGRKSKNRNHRTKNTGPARDRSRDQEERRTNWLRATQTVVEAAKLAWEIGNRYFWR